MSGKPTRVFTEAEVRELLEQARTQGRREAVDGMLEAFRAFSVEVSAASQKMLQRLHLLRGGQKR